MSTAPRIDHATATGLLLCDAALHARAALLRARFGLVRLASAPGTGFYVELGAAGLELRQAGSGAPGPIRVDLAAGPLAHRLRFGGGRGQPLARAVGMRPGFSPQVWDATAGLGRDAAVLASLGSRVLMWERSPVLAALLDDGLWRAARDDRSRQWVGARLQLRFADAIEAMTGVAAADRPEVVYLDPMYPAANNSALAKKEMRTLQQLLDGDQDSPRLLRAALETATRRVVVKRPKWAGWLADVEPSTRILSPNTRYDVYLIA